MKAIFISLIIFMAGFISADAQDVSFNKALEKVLSDYPQSFKNVRGDLIMEDEEEQRYISKIELPGAQDCLISLPVSGDKKLAKWEALYFSSTAFQTAADQYKNLHMQLLKSVIKLSKTNAKLRGDYASPNEAESFTSTVYSLSPATAAFRKVRVELELVKVLEEWRVNIRVGSGEFSE